MNKQNQQNNEAKEPHQARARPQDVRASQVRVPAAWRMHRFSPVYLKHRTECAVRHT